MGSLPILSIPCPSLNASRVLAAFRERMKQTAWAEHAPSTVWSPVGSPADGVQHLERQLQALYRAHVKVLHLALEEAPPTEHELGPLAQPLRLMRAFYRDWPLLQDNARTHPDAPLPDKPESFLYGRPDIVMGTEGPRVAETNFDTAVAGYDKPDDLWTVSGEIFGLDAAWLQHGRPLAGLRDYFSEFAGARPHLIHWIRSLAAAPECEPILAFLNQNPHGIQHIAHYAGEPDPTYSQTLPGHLHRGCTLYTVNRAREEFTRTLRPLVPKLQGCTVPLSLTVLQSKLFLACLSDPRTRPRTLTPEERDAVEALVPETRMFQQLGSAELEHVKRHREDFILKKTDSHLGRHVFFGCELEQDVWERLLQELPTQGAEPGQPPSFWLVQRRVRPQEYTLLEYTDEGPVERRTGLLCSPYLFGGRLRGFETWRIPFSPHQDMLGHSSFVGHFIR